jgi:hypothetical protein
VILRLGLGPDAAQVTVRNDLKWRSKYFHLEMRRRRKIAKVAMARRSGGLTAITDETRPLHSNPLNAL